MHCKLYSLECVCVRSDVHVYYRRSDDPQGDADAARNSSADETFLRLARVHGTLVLACVVHNLAADGETPFHRLVPKIVSRNSHVPKHKLVINDLYLIGVVVEHVNINLLSVRGAVVEPVGGVYEFE